MENGPPWEWVDGDPVLSRRFRRIMMADMAAMITLLALLILLVVLQGAGVQVHPRSSDPVYAGIVVLLPVGALFLPNLPRWFPVVRRLGISPLGVRLEAGFPERTSVWTWTEVKGIGPGWVALSKGGLIPQRFRLTAKQSERLSHFVRPWNDRLPLAS